MDDISHTAPEPLQAEPLPVPPQLTQPIAPWWHTCAILLLLGIWGSVGGRGTRSYQTAPHPALYLSMIMTVWMLFGSVIAGVHDRAAFFFQTLRRSAHTFSADVRHGAFVYVASYVIVIAFSLFAVRTIKVYRALHPAPPTAAQLQTKPGADQATGDNSTSPTTPTTPVTSPRHYFKTKTVLALAPHTPLELALWLLVSVTAGFCEEHVFRSYLLAQALALFRRSSLAPWLATSVSVLLTSLIFGSLHGYEGIGGAAVITLLGCIYAIAAIKLGNLRAVIVAHFLQDFVAGLILFVHHVVRPG